MEAPPSFRFDALSIMTHRPVHCQALGQLIAEWALAENSIGNALQWILDTDRETAFAIYEHFTSTRAKIDLIIRLNGFRTTEDSDREAIRELMDRAVELNTMRNKYVHAKWAVSDERPDEIQRIPQTRPQASSKKSEYEPSWLTVEQIRADIKLIAVWYQDIDYKLFALDPRRLNKG